MAETVTVDSLTVALRPGDEVLLCSDGLYDLVSDEAIAETLALGGSPVSKCRALITAANSLGGFQLLLATSMKRECRLTA